MLENINSYHLFYAGLFIFTILGILIFIVIGKDEQLNQMRSTVTKLRRSFNELDEEAKLIVKTDLDLNKAQEELDKRVRGLEALQSASRLISTTLDENEIFKRLDQVALGNLGFERELVLAYDENSILHPRINTGFSDVEVQALLASIPKEESLLASLKEGKTFSSINAPASRKETILKLFGVAHFVISPVLTKNGMIGLLFFGNRSNASLITGGDEELTSILANQIGQSLENARLFEQVYRSTQILETKVQERTKQLVQALEEVKKISKTKSDFISAVSHELRTPLTSIKGYASILMAGKLGNIPEAVADRLKKINDHSDNLVKLINELLDISRIESGRVEMNIGRADVRKMIENVHDLLIPQMREKNIRWKVTVSQRVPEMQLDASQVERVFINLVGNAIKYTPRDGTITVKADFIDNELRVDVSDTGIGIAEKDLEHLFNEFYRVDNEFNRTVKGTGLGLSLAKKIVQAHDGRMWVTSQPDHGTTFSFTLPFKEKKEQKT